MVSKKNLYIDCRLGIAGDMLMAALLGLIEEKDAFIKEMNEMFPMANLSYDCVTKGEQSGIKLNIVIENEVELCEDVEPKKVEMLSSEMLLCHENSESDGMVELLLGLPLNRDVVLVALSVYHELKMAECFVHGEHLRYIHNSKIGSLDAVIDIVGSCLLLEKIKPVNIYATAVNVGSGMVKYGTRIFDVPAPATARLLSTIPHFLSETIHGELVTPTGAAMLKGVVHVFDVTADEAHSGWAYGFGGKEFLVPTYTRVCLV